MLRECRPVLFIEMMCDEFNRATLTLLDSFGYAAAWILAPFMYPPEKVLREIPMELLFSGVNIIAVKKERSHELNVPNQLFPINVANKQFSYNAMNLTVYKEVNGELKKVTLAQPDCKNRVFPTKMREYWRALIDPSTGRYYE